MQKLASVLLVDDDATANFLNSLLLDSLGVAEQVLVAENGAEALQLLVHACTAPGHGPCPVLILLDVNMPVMNGFAFLEAFQQLAPAQQRATAVVMLTTSMHSNELARIQELPIAGLVSKPLTRAKVNTILQLHFQRQLPPEA